MKQNDELENIEVETSEITEEEFIEKILETTPDDKKDEDSPVRRFMAVFGIVSIIVFVIAACVCMALGNMELTMAAAFCVVVVPIAIYCFIWIYDMVHKRK